jgi:uncharacterized protein with GYD domain
MSATRAVSIHSFHEVQRPRYLIEGSYTAEGTKGVLQEGGSSRRDTVKKVIEGMGGTLEAFYFTFGDRDVIVIYSAPDEITAAALSMAVNQSGKVSLTTHPLLTPEDFDPAAKKTVAYRPPGS